MSILKQRAKEAIEQHGGATKAARALRINRTVLTLLADGKRTSCSATTLRALGLKAAGYEPITARQAPCTQE